MKKRASYEPPKVIPEITPFELVQTAQLLSAKDPDKDPDKELKDLFPKARQLLIEAATFLGDCKVKPLHEALQIRGVTFKEILASNEKNNSQEEKLLPGITTKEGLVKLIRRYFSARATHLPEERQDKSTIKMGHHGETRNLNDETGEITIECEFIPPTLLTKIRLWRDNQRKRNALKAKPAHTKPPRKQARKRPVK